MMPFMSDQLDYLKQMAKGTLSRLKQDKWEDTQIQLLWEELQRACSMGWCIAMEEVGSTPWEVMIVSLFRDTSYGARVPDADRVDAYLAEGWDIQCVCGPHNDYLLMRRRKAVGAIQAKSQSQIRACEVILTEKENTK